MVLADQRPYRRIDQRHPAQQQSYPACLPPNKTQQSTEPDITNVSVDLHDCISWQTTTPSHLITHLIPDSPPYLQHQSNLSPT